MDLLKVIFDFPIGLFTIWIIWGVWTSQIFGCLKQIHTLNIWAQRQSIFLKDEFWMNHQRLDFETGDGRIILVEHIVINISVY